MNRMKPVSWLLTKAKLAAMENSNGDSTTALPIRGKKKWVDRLTAPWAACVQTSHKLVHALRHS